MHPTLVLMFLDAQRANSTARRAADGPPRAGRIRAAPAASAPSAPARAARTIT